MMKNLIVCLFTVSLTVQLSYQTNKYQMMNMNEGSNYLNINIFEYKD
jgi:hypothetical protein